MRFMRPHVARAREPYSTTDDIATASRGPDRSGIPGIIRDTSVVITARSVHDAACTLVRGSSMTHSDGP